MKTNGLMYGRGRHGVAYGFVESTGLSRAAWRASLRARLSSAESSSGSWCCWGWSGVEAGAGAGARAEGEESLEVSSRNWASRSSVRDVRVEVWERVRLRVRWKARRSCLCFAERVSLGLASMDLARLRREVSLFLESAGSMVLEDWSPLSDGAGAAAASEFSGVSSPASSEVAGFFASFLPDRRSCLSFGAPVAKSTRSGSTWNMSPGLRR